jgi:prepilin-type processing-associated H-X9-DG protein
MGFTRWGQFVTTSGTTVGWTPVSAATGTGGADNTTGISGSTFGPSTSIFQKTGVMFLGTDSGNFGYDYHTSTSAIVDGSSTTILASENLLAGYSPASAFAGGYATNWACPHPNFMGFTASDQVFIAGAANLQPITSGGLQTDGTGWSLANVKNGTSIAAQEGINYGVNLSEEGGFPFASSNHNGGINVLFCDGSLKFISDNIDATVYSKLITPQGSKLPFAYRQLPVDASTIGD